MKAGGFGRRFRGPGRPRCKASGGFTVYRSDIRTAIAAGPRLANEYIFGATP